MTLSRIPVQTSDTTSSSSQSKYSELQTSRHHSLFLSHTSPVHQHTMSPVEVSIDEITGLATKAGLKLEEGHAEDYSILTSEFENLVASLGDDKLLYPKPDLTKYPRENVHIPEPKDADGGGWATKVSTENKTVVLTIADSKVRPQSGQHRR